MRKNIGEFKIWTAEELLNTSDEELLYYEKLLKKRKRNKYQNNRFKTDTEFKLKKNIRSNFATILKKYSTTGKTMSFFKYTGIEYSAYIDYFQKTQPEEFNLYLQGGYHIDHIIPCALYDFNNPEEIKKCWSPENLRIIPAEENLIKKDKLDLTLIEQHNIKHLLPLSFLTNL